MSVARSTAIIVLLAIAACATPAAPPRPPASGQASEPAATGARQSPSAATSSPSPSPSPSPARTDVPTSGTPAATAAPPDGVAAVVAFDQAVWAVVSVGDMIWVEAHDGTLLGLDGATGEQVMSVDGYGPFIAEGMLWFRRDDTLVAADPVTGEEMASYAPAALGPGTVVDGEYWTATEDRTMFRIDLDTNEVLSETALPYGEPKWVEAWAGAIWVVVDGLNVVVRVEPDTGKVLEVNAGSRPHSVATGFGSLWVTEHGATQLLRIGPTGDVEDTIPGVGINVAIAIGGDHVWAATPTGMARVDPETNEVVDEIELGAEDWYAATASQGSVWLTSPTANSLYQLPID